MSFQLKGGRLKVGQAAKDAFRQELKLQEAAKVLVKTVQANTPVRTGNLKGRWGTQAVTKWQGDTLRVDLVNTAPYASRVNRVGRHTGFVEKGIAEGRKRLRDELKVNLGHVGKVLWDGKA